MGKILILISILFCTTFESAYASGAGSVLKIELQNSIISLDPAHIQDVASLFISRQINCQLVRNIGAKYYLEAANSIKYISPLKIMVKINDNAKFQDGSLVTAEDVAKSFEYIRKSRTVLRNVFMWVDNIAVTDKKTIIFNLKKPIPKFLTVLSAPNYAIFKASFLEEAEQNPALWEYPIGGGGYKLVKRDNAVIHLLPVGSGLPIEFYLNQNDDFNYQVSNNFDIISDKFQHDHVMKSHYSEIQIFDPSQIYVGLNLRRGEWSNKDKRCNFLSKIDNSKLQNYYGNYAVIANDFIPIGAIGYDQSTKFFSNNMDKFKNKSFDSYKDICMAYLAVSIPDKYVDAYKSMFDKLSRSIRINKITNSKHFGANFSNSNCDILVFSLKSNYLDGYEYLEIFSNNDANFSGLKNDELSREIKYSQGIGDSTARAKFYRNIVKKIEESCVIRPLITIPMRYIYINNKVHAPGIGLGPLNEYYLGVVTKDS